jgi:hypothetical protein
MPMSNCNAPPRDDGGLDEKLERLDDVIFPAIDGDVQALREAEQLWSHTVAEVGLPALEESRHEYVRYARATWRLLQSQAIQQPVRLLAVMKIIAMLFGEDV